MIVPMPIPIYYDSTNFVGSSLVVSYSGLFFGIDDAVARAAEFVSDSILHRSKKSHVPLT